MYHLLFLIVTILSSTLQVSATCSTPLASRVHTTTLSLGGSIPINDEYHVAVIAPRPDGSSFLSWFDQNDQTIHLGTLSSNDATFTKLTTLSGQEVHSMLADANGVTMTIVDNDPDIYTWQYCKNATNNNFICGKMDIVRVTNTGAVTYRTTLTDKINAGQNGALFIWWYAHTARLAYNAANNQYAVYFRSAGTYNNNGAIEIHAGDTLRFVDATSGARINGGWEWGCSHSWSVRLASDSQNWGAACHGDAYPDAMQVARIPTSSLTTSNANTFLSNTDATKRALGGLVAATNGGFWLNYIDTDASGNFRVTVGTILDSVSGESLPASPAVAATNIVPGDYPFRPYMARIGTSMTTLLVAWKNNGVVQVSEYSIPSLSDATLSATTPTPTLLEGPVAFTAAGMDNFQDIFTAANGDVVWGYATGNGGTVIINRVKACTDGAATPAPTPAPTAAPTTKAPTPAPTAAPTTKAPTPAPTAAPTSAPTAATAVPTTSTPTAATTAPTTKAPTASPTTKAPTPTTSAPTTVAPTAAPTTRAPTTPPPPTWVQFTLSDSFPRSNAAVTTGTNVAAAESHALASGYVGFVLCGTTAYFRSQNAASLIANKKKATGCDLWVYETSDIAAESIVYDTADADNSSTDSSSSSTFTLPVIIGVCIGGAVVVLLLVLLGVRTYKRRQAQITSWNTSQIKQQINNDQTNWTDTYEPSPLQQYVQQHVPTVSMV